MCGYLLAYRSLIFSFSIVCHHVVFLYSTPTFFLQYCYFIFDINFHPAPPKKKRGDGKWKKQVSLWILFFECDLPTLLPSVFHCVSRYMPVPSHPRLTPVDFWLTLRSNRRCHSPLSVRLVSLVCVFVSDLYCVISVSSNSPSPTPYRYSLIWCERFALANWKTIRTPMEKAKIPARGKNTSAAFFRSADTLPTLPLHPSPHPMPQL